MIPIAALLGLLPKALKLIAPKLTTPVDAIIKELESKPEDPELIKALAQIELEHDKVDASVVLSDDQVAIAEIKSEHWFVWAARPFLLYCAGLGTVGLMGAMIAGVDLPIGPLADLMLPMWGHAGFYTYHRTQEKKALATA